MGLFYITGKIIASTSSKSFKVFVICEDKTRVFIGLITRNDLFRLLKGEFNEGDICKFSDRSDSAKVAQETLEPYSKQKSNGAFAYFG